MIIFQFKAKGILVPIYVIATLVGLFITKSLLNIYIFNEQIPEEVNGVVFSIALLISGFWTYYTSDDFYIDENGEKKYMYFDHQFMYIDMKSWAYVFWTIGGLAFVGSLIELITKLLK